MVGRLVEQQHVGHGDQRLRQRDTLFHPARELADVARAVQVQLSDRAVDALLPVPGVERLDPGLQRVEVDAVGMLLVSLTHRPRLGNALADGLEHRVSGLERGLLGHIANAQPLGQLQQAVVELFEPGDHLEHRGLAGAVAADQAQALAGV